MNTTTETIDQKQNMSDPNANKPGYKRAELDWFPKDWSIIELKDISNISSGGTPKKEITSYWDGNIPWLTTSLVYFQKINKAETYITKEGLNNSAAKIFPKGTIIMAMYGQGRTRGQVGLLGIEAATNQACAGIKIRKSLADIKYVFYTLIYKYKNIRELGHGGNQKNLNLSLIRRIKISLPPLPEQQKIAQILSTWDQAIEKTEQLIEKKQRLKKGLMQQLFKGKMRFEEFKEANELQKTKIGLIPKDWQIKKASEIFDNVSVKNNDVHEALLSATQEYGVIPRNMLEGKVTMPNGNLNTFKLVEKGDFVISLRTFQGGIEYSYYRGLVSPAYTVIKEKLPINKDFYRHFFKTKDFISRLASSVIGIRDGKQINYSDFKLLQIIYPPIEDQNKIAGILNRIEKEIEIWKSYNKKLKQQKKGLMQQLLTGRIRVKTDNN